MTGKGKDKEKKEGKKESKGWGRKVSTGGASGGGGDDVDTAEADLVAALANHLVKEERRKRPGIRHKKKGKNDKKRISES